jgi:hypothetical protein
MKVYNNTYDKDALQSIWMSKLSSMFTKFSTSVALQRIPVTIERKVHVGTPAFSTADSISLFHQSGTNISSASSIRRLKGLTIHELAHVLYTPRQRSTVGQFVHTNTKFFNAFNILEDSRIENLMVARMSGVRPWLTDVIVNEIINDTNNSPLAEASVYTLVYGRKYLDPKLITAARTAFTTTYPSLVDSLHDIVDKYIRLTFHNKEDSSVAISLIQEFYNLLSLLNAPMTTTHEHNQSATPTSGSNKIDGKRAIDKDMAQVEEMAKEQSAKANADTDDDSEPATGGSDAPNSSSSGLSQVLREVNEQTQQQIHSDIKATREQITEVGSSAHVDMNKVDNNRLVVRNANHRFVKYDNPSQEARNISAKFSKHLLDIKAIADPYWERKTDVGRLNVRNFMLDRNLDEAFDRWDDSQSEATDIEAVILLDVSGSMNNMITPAYNAMWSIKRAFDSVEASTTVLQYGDYGITLYNSDERAGIKVKMSQEGRGSTFPLGSLLRAHQILTESTRTIKMLLIITDGDWAHSDEADQTIVSMRSQGILTGLAFLIDPEFANQGQEPWWLPRDAEGNAMVNAHRCEVAVDTSDPNKLVDFAKSLADLSRAKLQN